MCVCLCSWALQGSILLGASLLVFCTIFSSKLSSNVHPSFVQPVILWQLDYRSTFQNEAYLAFNVCFQHKRAFGCDNASWNRIDTCIVWLLETFIGFVPTCPLSIIVTNHRYVLNAFAFHMKLPSLYQNRSQCN